MPLAALMSSGALLLPGAAAAEPPSCPDLYFVTPPDQRVDLPADPCTDPEDDPYTVALLTQPTMGQVVGTSAYIPFPSAHGFDEFTYRAEVAGPPPEASEPATVRLLVDRQPTCSDAAASVQAGATLVLPPLPCTDADGDALTTYLDDPEYGTLTYADDDSTITYAPPDDFSGTDTILFSAEEVEFPVGSDVRTLTITVTAAPPGGAARDVVAPRVRVRRPRARLRAARAKGLAVRFTTTEAGVAAITLRVGRATARRLGLRRRPGRAVPIGRARRPVAAGETRMRVKLTPAARRALRGARRVRVRIAVVVTDAAGNAGRGARTVRLRR